MTIAKLASYSMPELQELPQSRLHWPLRAERAMLLVHDLQNYFLSFYDQDSPLIQQMLSNVTALCDWAHANNVPVVFTAQPREQSAVQRGLLCDAWGAGLTNAPEELLAINAQVAPRPGDRILKKWRYSAFQRSELSSIMAEQGRDQLLICGVYAHIGCHATALEAFMSDVQPFSVIDAQADFSQQHHRQAMALVASTCGRVIETSMVLTCVAAP